MAHGIASEATLLASCTKSKPSLEDRYSVVREGALFHLDRGAVSIGGQTPHVPSVQFVVPENYAGGGGYEMYVFGGPARAIQVIASIHDLTKQSSINEIKKLDRLATKLPGIIFIVAVDTATPFEVAEFTQKYLVQKHGYKNLIMTSAYQSSVFLCFFGPDRPQKSQARGIYVIAPNGRLVYRQLLLHNSTKLNYASLIKSIKERYLSYGKNFKL